MTTHVTSSTAQPFWGGCGSAILCVPLLAAKNQTKKPNGKTLDDTLLIMGPPGDRTRHMLTERTEDFSWIVDLSWHGMRPGESEIVTTEEKKRTKTSAASTSKLRTWRGEIFLADVYPTILRLSLVGYPPSHFCRCSWQGTTEANYN